MNLRLLQRNRKIVLASATILVLLVAASVVVIVGRNAGGVLLVSQSDGSAAGASQAPGARRYHTAYFGSVCVSEPGTVKIRSVEPVRPHGGLKVTDLLVMKPRQLILGGGPGRLRDEPSYKGSATVTAVCPDSKHVDLFLELYKPRAENAWAEEYRINYESDGRPRSARLQYGYGLCEQSPDDCEIF